MAFYKHNNDKKSGDGLAITEWNTLSSAIAGNSGLHFAINSADRVGIGTITPGAKVDINGGLDLSANDSTLHFTQNKVKQFLTFGSWGSNAYGIGVQNSTQYFRSNKDFAWFQNGIHSDERLAPGTGGTALMVLKDGKLGIGTNNPSEKLHVEDGKFYVKSSHNNATADIGTFFAKNLTQGIGIGYNRIEAIGSNADQDIFLMPKGTGKVGIGTDDPSGLLHLKHTGDVNLILEADSNNVGENDHPIIHFKQDNALVTAEVGYFGSTNSFRVKNNYGDAALVLKDNGNIGIGTENPTKAKLEVSGFVQYTIPEGYGWYNESGSGKVEVAASKKYSIYASGRIASTQFDAHSDSRIKKIVGISAGGEDLQTLMGIHISDYQMIDTLANGSRMHKKVIGQQLADAYPQAVTKNLTEVIPDIYQAAEFQEGWIVLETDLSIGERVQIINETSIEVYEVLEVEGGRFRVKNFRMEEATVNSIFVYGREVDDFHLVDYEAISMLNVSATQEIYRNMVKLEKRLAKLENQTAKA